MLSIFPFEKDWYAERVPEFPVEFVGHPLVDRFPLAKPGEKSVPLDPDLFTEQPTVLLLPGSRRREIDKHLPVMLEAAVIFSEKVRTRLRMVLPSDEMHEDRKSTRLNSSHKPISYAVFCLKKQIGFHTRRQTTSAAHASCYTYHS